MTPKPKFKPAMKPSRHFRYYWDQIEMMQSSWIGAHNVGDVPPPAEIREMIGEFKADILDMARQLEERGY